MRIAEAIAAAAGPMPEPAQARFHRGKRKHPGTVTLYFLAGGGLVKIGISANLKSRIRAIRNSSPIPLDLIGTVKCCSAQEGLVHSRLHRFRRHGEWFEDCTEVRAMMAHLIKMAELGAL